MPPPDFAGAQAGSDCTAAATRAVPCRAVPCRAFALSANAKIAQATSTRLQLCGLALGP